MRDLGRDGGCIENIRFDCLLRIKLALNVCHSWVLVEMVMNHLISYRMGNPLRCRNTIECENWRLNSE